MRRSRPGRLRPVLVLAMVVVAALAFVGRLVDVQVVHASTLRAESKDRRSQEVVTPGTRGAIVDASGVPLATTVPRYTITASPALAAEAAASPRTPAASPRRSASAP